MKIDFIEYQHQHEFLYNECANIIFMRFFIESIN